MPPFQNPLTGRVLQVCVCVVGVLVKIGFEVGLGPGVELGTRVANGVTVG